MLRQIVVRCAARQAVVRSQPVILAPALVRSRPFGAVAEHKPETALASPFPGASRSEPEMEYTEEPSMLYMTALVASPWVFSFWFLTKFV